MIIRVYSHKDCVAINTDRIDFISVDYTLDLKIRKFLCKWILCIRLKELKWKMKTKKY